jgi:hypothetical protein
MITMPMLERAFNRVRQELCDVGLLADGIYLDRIDRTRSLVPAIKAMGWVYDRELGFWRRLFGFREGIIYVPFNASVSARVPGQTLLDVVRHEYAHAWAWVDRRWFRGRWFRDAFRARYDDVWEETEDAAWTKLTKRSLFGRSPFWTEFVSAYAMVRPAEDFAETFMYYLRYRRSLASFRNRPGVYRKLRAIGHAVQQKRRQLGL